MDRSDSKRGEENIFFPHGFTDPKHNLLSYSIFDKVVKEVGMSGAHCLRFLIPDDADPENLRPISVPHPGEKTMSPFKKMWVWGFLIVRIRWKCVLIIASLSPNFIQMSFAFDWASAAFYVKDAVAYIPLFFLVTFIIFSQIALAFFFLWVDPHILNTGHGTHPVP